ncbi:putative PH-like domain superfamily, NECAP, PHear domain-containing protein [Helianthus annuus]|uniref:PH-like domain superfamily, NECAP, PHear domain-containing protein n=1 Tax=Helianthus annuus TaxID=4232 RepID=A0A251RRK6_HELAN|nr:uncharacterized protein At1g03900 [Helianthus annuus]KAF5756151.1 putative PH-like domain superfamily, NECAP, PHear domain-containing protein [Helianthus annuus]KAJ0429697.1 putative PH-like domain superfamily, NECAP, PHear domain-containing protein [Helianthus annuus]KAJ0434338.1 putative PH-like domain superfamily, NECAP, PHear domain-containing protein [Helianthus annuus]KAJ0448139.1 putative PH-like domain superfamily, NECAP, PHear domain-containing protein [Helianthus annuus]KAJ0633024
MDKNQNPSNSNTNKDHNPPILDDSGDIEPAELILFQVSECYVYLIPPRKTAASYRADEWDINKWAWEGTMKVVSKGEECIIKLEDKTTGELYARAFLRDGEPHPVEPVIDSSRYFVLRVEENIGGRLRHAFIGIGFRERPQAYDFQAALHDHMKYLNKKKTAEEMEQQFQQTSSVDYSLKDGETLVLQLKNKGGSSMRSKFFEQGLNNPADQKEKGKKEVAITSIPPPPPPSPLSPPVNAVNNPLAPSRLALDESPKDKSLTSVDQQPNEPHSAQDLPDDDFGDFQAA